MVQTVGSKPLRAGTLAEAVGVSPDTIRHYERLGILPGATRTASGTPRSNYVIGAACLLLAAFGTAAVALLHLIPVAMLGVFLIYVGVQHSLYLRDIAGRLPSLLIAILVVVVAALTMNLMWGFSAGLALQICLRLGRGAASSLRHNSVSEEPH